jgi:putative ABC transport system permease protein
MIWVNNRTLGWDQDLASYPNFVDWRDNSRSFKSMAVYTLPSFTVTGDGGPERVQAAVVSGDFFQVLDVNPFLGRTLVRDDEEQGRELAVISHGFWQRRFGSAPDVVGQKITLEGTTVEIIGVMPPDFEFPRGIEVQYSKPADIWAPISPASRGPRGTFWLRTIGRLESGVTVAQAQAEMEAIAAVLVEKYPETNEAEYGINIMPLHKQIVGGIRPALLLLLGAVVFVLLIACANVANLLLSRAVGRQREIAIRTALGASRARLIRQLLTESLVLSLAGGFVGFLIAVWGVELLITVGPSNIPRVGEITVDTKVLLFTIIVSVLTGLIFGLLPALHSSKVGPNESLKEGSRSVIDGRRSKRVSNVLVVGEVALALILVVGAGLMIRSVIRFQEADPGLVPEHLLMARIDLSARNYRDRNQILAFYSELTRRVESLPGVHSVALIPRFFQSKTANSTRVAINRNPTSEPVEVPYDMVSPGYFHAIGSTLVQGREFKESDNQSASRVAVINQTMAERFWPGGNAIGREFRLGLGDNFPWLTVVGVVRDVHRTGLDIQPRPEAYMPFLQFPSRGMSLIVRTEDDPSNLVAALRSEVQSLDKNQPLSSVQTMEELLSGWVAPRRFNMVLLIVFAALALALAVTGIYAVISNSVNQRVHEIGVRLALGAGPLDIIKSVVWRGMGLALMGTGLGVIGSILLTRLMKNLLFNVSATDPITFGATTLLLAGVALLASYVPARRASRVDPMVALRYE